MMSSSLLARQITPLLALTGHESYSVLRFRSSRTRSSESHRQQRHVHFDGPPCQLRPRRRRAFVVVGAMAVGFTTALLIYKAPSKKSHWWPVWLLKAWLRVKWKQLRLWPERLQTWAKYKWRRTWFGKDYAGDNKERWKGMIAQKAKWSVTREAARRRKQEWAQRVREGFVRGKTLFQQQPRKKQRADDWSTDTEQALEGGKSKGSKRGKKDGRDGSKK